MSTTFDRLSMILQKSFNLAPERLTPDATLASLDIDSLGTVELLWKVEEAFRITIPAAPINPLTLSDVVQHIDQLVARSAAPLSKPPRVGPATHGAQAHHAP